MSITSAASQDIILSVVLSYKNAVIEGFVLIEKLSGSVSIYFRTKDIHNIVHKYNFIRLQRIAHYITTYRLKLLSKIKSHQVTGHIKLFDLL